MTPTIDDDPLDMPFRRLFRERWQAGQRLSAEQFCQEFPDLSTDAEQLLDLIVCEWNLRAQAGEEIDKQDYLSRFPQFQTDLQLRFASWEAAQAALLTLSHVAQNLFDATTPQRTPSVTSPSSTERIAPGIPGYRILSFIDSGGQGEVWRAEDSELGRQVAIKILRADLSADPTHVERFRREAKTIAKLDHDHIVQVFDFGEAAGRLYLAMELLEGGNLRKRLSGEPMEPRTAAGLIITLASALAEAHRVGIVHRDLKPENILFHAKGRLKITDFGMAKHLGDAIPNVTVSGGLMGTIYYMSPEQAAGRINEIGPPSDVWALGVMLYELLTGRRPFEGTRGEVLGKIQYVEATPLTDYVPTIPRELIKICYRCLAKQHTNRYSDAEELLEVLQNFLNADTENEPSSSSSSAKLKAVRDSVTSWRETHTIIEGWGTWIDPVGRCDPSLQEGKLTMLVPGGDFDLGIERRVMNAPRILKEITGDFTLQALVSCYMSPIHPIVLDRPAFQGAGLLLLADSQNYIRLEKAALARRGQTIPFINYEVRSAGKLIRPGRQNEGVPIPTKKTYLRLRRVGNRVYGWISNDRFRWRDLEELELNLPDKLEVGIVAVNLSDEGFFPVFSECSITDATTERPT